MKPKLLITASTFPRWPGDTEPRFVLDLANAMKKEFDITILAPAAPGAKDADNWGGLPIKRFHYFPIHKWETLCYPGAIVPRIKQKKIRALLVPFLCLSLFWNLWRCDKRFDAVHAHWLVPQGILQSFFKTPYLLTGHGADVSSLNTGPVKTLKKRCIRKASAITAVSTHLQNILLQYAPTVPVQVLPMGCDTDAFSRGHRQVNFFGQGDKKVVLFVGRLAEKKGVRYLLEAFGDIDAKLVIVGTGPLEHDLKIQAHSLGDKVLFLGAKTHEELKVIYASADVFCAPSVEASDGDIEGFGLVFLEAMASGLPVVASRSGGITDLVVDGQNGLLSPPKDPETLARQLNHLLSDISLQEKLRKNAYITAREYNYQNVAAKYARILHNIIKSEHSEVPNAGN